MQRVDSTSVNVFITLINQNHLISTEKVSYKVKVPKVFNKHLTLVNH